jgi:hypothetical protein
MRREKEDEDCVVDEDEDREKVLRKWTTDAQDGSGGR